MFLKWRCSHNIAILFYTPFLKKPAKFLLSKWLRSMHEANDIASAH